MNAAPLTIQIYSFSYKYSDKSPLLSGNDGGGFIFDCRAVPNPGREQRYKPMTGKDAEVGAYLEQIEIFRRFKQHIFSTVDLATEGYIERGFTNLSVAFGCTGGQHRSVYLAEELKKHLQEKFGEKVVCAIDHIQLTQGIIPNP